jgi:transcriptional regulator with XRE-family HTH domain
MIQFAQLHYANPKMTQPEIAKLMGISTSTLQRARRNLSMPSFYRYKLPCNAKFR